MSTIEQQFKNEQSFRLFFESLRATVLLLGQLTSETSEVISKSLFLVGMISSIETLIIKSRIQDSKKTNLLREQSKDYPLQLLDIILSSIEEVRKLKLKRDLVIELIRQPNKIDDLKQTDIKLYEIFQRLERNLRKFV